MTWLLPICTCLLLLTGCGGGMRGNFMPVAAEQSAVAPDGDDLLAEELSGKRLEELYARSGIVERDPALKEALQNWEHQVNFDVPIQMNKQVGAYLVYFSRERKDVVRRWLARSTRYLPMVKEIFQEYGLPEDLAYLAMVESGFNPDAASPAGAVGMWQFIKGTGLRYGLVVDGQADERRDPVKSTHAAARYLTDLYKQFGSWYLAAASYNCGERRVQQELRKTNLKNFWELSANRCLPSETKNYVPQMIAATIIAKNPEKFGFNNVPYQSPATRTMLAAAPPPPPLVRPRRYTPEAPTRPQPAARAAAKSSQLHARASSKPAPRHKAGSQAAPAQARNNKPRSIAKSHGTQGVYVASMFGSPHSGASHTKANQNSHQRQSAASPKKAKTPKTAARHLNKKSPALLARKGHHPQGEAKIASKKKSSPKSKNKKIAARNKGLLLSQAR
jgi:soluble lytic murein transglycosylase-like protein